MDTKYVKIARVHLQYAGHFVVAQVEEKEIGNPQEVKFFLESPNEEKLRRITREDATLLVQMTAVAYPPGPGSK